MPARPRRSVLYLPASNLRALAKARTLAAGAEGRAGRDADPRLVDQAQR